MGSGDKDNTFGQDSLVYSHPCPCTHALMLVPSLVVYAPSSSCNKTKRYTYLSFVVVVDVVVIFRLIRIQLLVYPLTLPFIPNMILIKGFHIHM